MVTLAGRMHDGHPVRLAHFDYGLVGRHFISEYLMDGYDLIFVVVPADLAAGYPHGLHEFRADSDFAELERRGIDTMTLEMVAVTRRYLH